MGKLKPGESKEVKIEVSETAEGAGDHEKQIETGIELGISWHFEVMKRTFSSIFKPPRPSFRAPLNCVGRRFGLWLHLQALCSRATSLLPKGHLVAERRLALRAPTATVTAPGATCAGSTVPRAPRPAGAAVLQRSDQLSVVRAERYVATLAAARFSLADAAGAPLLSALRPCFSRATLAPWRSKLRANRCSQCC